MAEIYRHPFFSDYGSSSVVNNGDTPLAPSSLFLDISAWSQIVDDDLYESQQGGTFTATGTSDGIATATGVGQSTAEAISAVAGLADAKGAGIAIVGTIGTIAGAATTSAAGSSIAVHTSTLSANTDPIGFYRNLGAMLEHLPFFNLELVSVIMQPDGTAVITLDGPIASSQAAHLGVNS